MIPPQFDYHRATSVDDALRALLAAGPDARPLAGGQSLIPMLKLRFAEPTTLVDLGGIRELTEIRNSGDLIRIGAMATHKVVTETVGVLPGMDSFRHVGRALADLQVRAMGTFVGSIAHADPAGDWPAVVLAHGASIEIASVGATRRVAASDFFDGAFTTTVQAGEIITSIIVPTTPAASAYVKISDPANGYARAGICVAATTSRSGTSFSIAATGAASQPFRMSTLEQAAIGNRSKAELEEAAGVDIPADSLADRDPYRGQLVRVAARRAVLQVLHQLSSAIR